MNREVLQPLFERIIILGVSSDDLEQYFLANKIVSKKLGNVDVTKQKIKILEEYKSNELKETQNDNYIDNLTMVYNFIKIQ
jgi:hypothetical protein